MAAFSDNPLAPVVKLWLSLMEKARDHKWEAFGKTAWECYQFYDGAHDFMYKNALNSVGMYAEGEAPKTTFRMTMNKVAELVQLFAPSMYYKNPRRQANPNKPELPEMAIQLLAQQQAQAIVQQQLQQFGPMGGSMMAPGMMAQPDPMMVQQMMQQAQQQVMQTIQIQQQANIARDQAVAKLIEWVQNLLPNELDLKTESRLAIDEALVKGRGVVLHEMYLPPGSKRAIPKATWFSVDDLLVDPDARSMKDAMWVAVRCQEPIWQVERDRGLEPGSLKSAANLESMSRQAEVDTGKHGSHYRRRGDTHDLITYYKIWSRGGLGQHLTIGQGFYPGSELEPIQDGLAQFGDHTYIEVAEGIDYPLNLPPALMEADVTQPGIMELVKKQVSWAVPFYKDQEWPVTELDFHLIPGSPWPQAHMKPALGELRFLNWAMSFLAGRIRVTSRVFIGIVEHLAEDLRTEVESGGDLTILPIKTQMNKTIQECIQFLQHPEVNKDIWAIINAVMELFDKRVGLTELVYGISGKQMRSAQEASVKEERTSVRPDDMAERVEHWQTRIARKEAQMLRLYCGPDAAAPWFGEKYDPSGNQFGIMTHLWAQHVYLPADQSPENIERVFREYEYRIEAGSARKPNMERDQANMDQAMQVLFNPLYQHYQMSGDPTQLNAFITDWAKCRQLDASPYLFPPFQVMPQPAPGGGPPGGDQGGPPAQTAA